MGHTIYISLRGYANKDRNDKDIQIKGIYCTNNALDSKEAQLQPYNMVYRIGLLSW